MSREDWYRNTDWNSEIESAFFAKLRRAREKNQYLRIQASYLSESHPDTSLHLLDQYFVLGDYFDHAQAHVTRADAYIALGKIGDAVASYEDALERETAQPNSHTQAYIDLPFFIATRELAPLYQRALDLVRVYEQRLMFPVDRFKWHAVRALIASASARPVDARTSARAALDAAGIQHSGFRYHKSVGLVGNKYAAVCERLSTVAT